MKKILFFVVVVIFVFSVAGFSFQTELIRVGGDKIDKVLVLVDKNIFPDIQSELDAYLDSLEKEWSYECWKVEAREEIEEIRELRRFIIQRHSESGVKGVFFIDGGNFPLVHVGGFHVPIATETYWMDVDSQQWEMWEYDGKIWISPKKVNDVFLEVFVSRIRGTVEDIRKYLRKIVEYRNERDELEEDGEDGLFYCQEEGEVSEDLELLNSLAQDEIETVECQSCDKECFLNFLKKTRKWVDLSKAGGVDGGNGHILPSGEEVSVEEIKNIAPGGRFYFLWGGNSINYDVPDYVGSAYLFSGNGVGIFGGVELGGTCNLKFARPRLYSVLRKGFPIGIAQQNYTRALMYLEQGYIVPAYSYLMAGDPTIIGFSRPPAVRTLLTSWVYQGKLNLKAEVENTTRNPMKVKAYLLVRIPCHPACGFLTFFFNGKEWTTEPVSVPIEISPGEKKVLKQSVSISNLQIDHDPHDIWEFGIVLFNPFIEAVLDWDIFYICPFNEIPQ